MYLPPTIYQSPSIFMYLSYFLYKVLNNDIYSYQCGRGEEPHVVADNIELTVLSVPNIAMLKIYHNETNLIRLKEITQI